jgi:hypothetical protein
MTPADRDTLLTLVQQWREKAIRLSKRGDTLESASYAYEAVADALTALLARLTPPDPEKNGESDVV